MVLIIFYPTRRIKETHSITVATRHFMLNIISTVYCFFAAQYLCLSQSGLFGITCKKCVFIPNW